VSANGRPPLWAIVGTIVFTALVPGSVVCLGPYLLTYWVVEPPLLGTALTRVAGVLLLVASAPLFTSFIARFVVEGHGTPAPLAPTRHLVVGGPFRWTRNPGYIAVLGMIVGQGLLLGSGAVLVYAAAVALAFQIFVIFYEEPTLRRTYGAEFDRYCGTVPRWIPRRPRSG
jgi:protein-S-isoprenylcysteine O-methyltransferase Ste14